MELVIDANILMSALIASEGRTIDLIFNEKLRLFAPDYLIGEISAHEQEILEKSKLSRAEFDVLLSIVSSRIDFVPKSEFTSHLRNAEAVTPDEDDAEYFALALKLGCAIWSNDKKLKTQATVKIFSTAEVMNMISV